jgi:hypothetical protein
MKILNLIYKHAGFMRLDKSIPLHLDHTIRIFGSRNIEI